MRFTLKEWKLECCMLMILGILAFISLTPPLIKAQDEEPAPAKDAQEAPAPTENIEVPVGREAASTSGSEPTATLIFNNSKIDQILLSLKKQTGVNVIARGKAAELRLDIVAQNESVSQILQKIASSKGMILYREDDMNYQIMDEATYIKDILPKQVIRKIFVLKYIKAEEARKALANVSTKGIGQMAADPRTNKLIVTDLPQVVEYIKRLLDEIDVQLLTRVFYIRYADVAAIAEKLKNYKSAPGTIEVDPRTHQIIVYDIFQNIKRMEMLVEVLDVGPEIRVYNLNNIGIEGKAADQLGKAIEQVITKNAEVFWQIDDKTGTLVVQDVPEVHEKIEQILAALDQPIKQVLIYAELIDTSFNKSYDFGISWDVSEDLFAATRDGLFPKVPKGSTGNLTDNLGFINLHEEYPTFSMTGSGLAVGYLNKYFRANLSAALTKSDTKILLQPRIIVKNQEEAKIHVGGSLPYRTTNYYGGTDNNNRSSGQASVEYGLDLTMKPSISNNGLIEMEIDISNSDASFVDEGDNDPLVAKREVSAKTVLIIPSGETRVLAGLMNNSDTDVREGIPFLAEIPIIGPAIFGKKSETDSTRNIMFFITPTIIEEKTREKNYYKGKRIEELFGEEAKLLAVLGLTSPTLTSLQEDQGTSPTKGPALSSSQPVDLPRLLGSGANLDARTLRQERIATLPGPDGTFVSAAPPAPSAPVPPRPEDRPESRPESTPPKEDKGKEPEEQKPPGEYQGGPRPSRPSSKAETEY